MVKRRALRHFTAWALSARSDKLSPRRRDKRRFASPVGLTTPLSGFWSWLQKRQTESSCELEFGRLLMLELGGVTSQRAIMIIITLGYCVRSRLPEVCRLDATPQPVWAESWTPDFLWECLSWLPRRPKRNCVNFERNLHRNALDMLYVIWQPRGHKIPSNKWIGGIISKQNCFSSSPGNTSVPVFVLSSDIRCVHKQLSVCLQHLSWKQSVVNYYPFGFNVTD